MINKSPRTIFLHIPKCAGTAVRKLVEKRKSEEIINGLPEDNTSRFVIGHFGYKFIKRFQEPITKITFLRNPVDRTLSHYFYWKTLDVDHIGPQKAKELNLLDFLNSDIPAIREQLDNIQSWMLIADYRMSSRKNFRIFLRMIYSN